jgi:hypothetical protein
MSRPDATRLGILFVLSSALAGCTTSAQNVMFESPDQAGEAVPLSVAWADMEARMNSLQAELVRTRAALDSLCGLPGATQALCSRVDTLETNVTDTAGEVAAINPAIDRIAARIEATEAVLSPVSYDARTGDWRLTGVNLHVRNAGGSTDGIDGRGNIVIGWNESAADDARTGSHNLIVGAGHDWESHSGILSGTDHLLIGPGGAALGGEGNTVTAEGAVALGGQDNVAAGLLAVTIGGTDNVVEGELGLAVGGSGNDVDGTLSVALGGLNGSVADDGWVLLGPMHGPELPDDLE